MLKVIRAETFVKDDRISFRLLLENDEEVKFAFDEEDCDELTTRWLARDTPALAMPIDTRRLTEAILKSDKPSARFARGGIL